MQRRELKRAAALGNRGPLRLGPNGRLVSEILDAYGRTGFYVFEDVIDEAELAALRGELEGLLERAPVDNGAEVDRQGRPPTARNSLARSFPDPSSGGSLGRDRSPRRPPSRQNGPADLRR